MAFWDINDAALLALNGGNSGFILERGIDLYNEGDYVMAKLKFEDALTAGNKEAEEWIEKCNRGIIDKLYPKALQHLREDERVMAANALGTIYAQTGISLFEDMKMKCLSGEDTYEIISYCEANYETQVVRNGNNNGSQRYVVRNDNNDNNNFQQTVGKRRPKKEVSKDTKISSYVHNEKKPCKIDLPPQLKSKLLPVGVGDDFDFREKDVFETEQEYKDRFFLYQDFISKQQIVLGSIVINDYDDLSGVAMPNISLNKKLEVFGVKIEPVNINSIFITKKNFKKNYIGKQFEIIANLQIDGGFYSDIKVNKNTIKIKITDSEFCDFDYICSERNVMPDYILPLGTVSPLRSTYDINKKSLDWEVKPLDFISSKVMKNFHTIVERDTARVLCNTSDIFKIYGVFVGLSNVIKVRLLSSSKLGNFFVSDDNKLVSVNAENVISNLNIHIHCKDYIYTPFYSEIERVATEEKKAARLKAQEEARRAQEEARRAQERARALAEAKAIEEEEARKKAEEKATRLKAQEEARRAQEEARRAQARARALAEAKAKEEEETRKKAEEEKETKKRRKRTVCIVVPLILLLFANALGCIGTGWLPVNGTTHYIHKAFSNFKTSSELNRLGNHYFWAKDYMHAFLYFRDSAQKGSAAGLTNLGYCYEYGYAVKKDFRKAVECYTIGSEKGDIDAMYRLGNCYYQGEYYFRDPKKAVAWFTKAADKNQAASIYMLGECYEYGIGVHQNRKKAKELYDKAKRLGFK